jgi:hypothetical protein
LGLKVRRRREAGVTGADDEDVKIERGHRESRDRFWELEVLWVPLASCQWEVSSEYPLLHWQDASGTRNLACLTSGNAYPVIGRKTIAMPTRISRRTPTPP